MNTSIWASDMWLAWAPLCSVWSRLLAMTRAGAAGEPLSAPTAPPRSTQSSDRITSASATMARVAGLNWLKGSVTWAGWSVGNTARSFRSDMTMAPRRSTRSTRLFQASTETPQRPMSTSGRWAPLSSSTALAMDSLAGRGGAGGWKRSRSGKTISWSSEASCKPASSVMNTGAGGSARVSRLARHMASISASGELGCASHFTMSRTMPP